MQAYVELYAAWGKAGKEAEWIAKKAGTDATPG